MPLDFPGSKVQSLSRVAMRRSTGEVGSLKGEQAGEYVK